MTQEVEFTGVIRNKKVIELDNELDLPKGSRVRLRLQLATDEPLATVANEAEVDAESDKTLQEIHRMRHLGRSVQKPSVFPNRPFA